MSSWHVAAPASSEIGTDFRRRMALPNFLCIGAQKAGTTALFDLLKQHPDIFLFPNKETHYFNIFRHDLPKHHYEWAYFARYDGQRRLGEISPEYLRVPGAARAIRQRLGPIKIIICLRDPLARAFSHYLHCLRAAEDNRSFFEACRSDAGLPLWSGAHDDISRAYVRGSWYAYQIEEWQSQFGAEHLFFCVLERDLADKPAKSALMTRLFDFLGVATSGVEINLDVPKFSAGAPTIFFSETRQTVNLQQQGIHLIEPGDVVVQTGSFQRVVRRPSPELRSFFEKMAREMTPSLSLDDQRSLRRTYFADVADQVSQLLGEDLTAMWDRADASSPAISNPVAVTRSAPDRNCIRR